MCDCKGHNGVGKRITKEMEGWTVERVLRHDIGVSRGLIRKAKKSGSILLSGRSVKTCQRVSQGEMLEMKFEDEINSITPQRMSLDIRYEDSAVLVVNKAAGILVHPLTTEPTGTLANGVLYYWMEQGESYRFRPVHRLDRNTSGLVLVAKSAYVHHRLAQQLASKSFTRRYIALVQGTINEAKGTIREPIGLAEGSHIKRVISPLGKEAVSNYWVLRKFGNASLVCVELETGRTHQVRVHMAHLGHPLLGDDLYGGDTQLIDRQGLHCSFLAFTHPLSGLKIKVACPLPDDIKKLISSKHQPLST